MPKSRQQKMMGKNDPGLYQVRPSLSTTTISLAGIDRWLHTLLTSQPPHIWLLSGPIGAGKTTLVQHLARLLGVEADVTSPTFALQKIHPIKAHTWEQLVHIDAYRIQGAHELAALELHEYIADPASLLVVEWPERLGDVAWGAHLKITLDTTKGQSRDITVKRSG